MNWTRLHLHNPGLKDFRSSVKINFSDLYCHYTFTLYLVLLLNGVMKNDILFVCLHRRAGRIRQLTLLLATTCRPLSILYIVIILASLACFLFLFYKRCPFLFCLGVRKLSIFHFESFFFLIWYEGLFEYLFDLPHGVFMAVLIFISHYYYITNKVTLMEY